MLIHEATRILTRRTAKLSWQLVFVLVVFGVCAFSANALELTSTNFKILDPVIHVASSTEMSSTNFRLTGTVGQPAIGTSTATNFNISSGFLFYPFVSKPTATAFAGNQGAGLYWTAASGLLGWTVSGYSIGRSTTSGGPYTYTTVASTTATHETGLTNGTAYYFVVRPEDAFGNAIATSTEVSTTPTANVTHSMSGDLDTRSASTTIFATSAGPKVTLSIPADVLSSGIRLNTEFLVRPESVATVGKALPSGKLAANTFYGFTFKKQSDLSEVTSLDKSITFTFTYTDDDISGINESTLEVRRWDDSAWTAVSGSSVDTAANIVTVSTASFSDFGLFGNAPAEAAAAPAPAPSGGGGGDGGGRVGPTAEERLTRIVLKGLAYPFAQLTVFKDGTTVATPRADKDGAWSAATDVQAGVQYNFSVYAVDDDNVRSLTVSINLSVSQGFTFTTGNIVIPPTATPDKSEVRYGNDIQFYGSAFPRSEISVIINSPEPYMDTTLANASGTWQYILNSANIERGEHVFKSQQKTPDGLLSSFSESLRFVVGDRDAAFQRKAPAPVAAVALPLKSVCSNRGDLNNDGKVNIVDFSILLFFWNQRSPSNPCADINGDGVANLFDFSIMLFWWNG